MKHIKKFFITKRSWAGKESMPDKHTEQEHGDAEYWFGYMERYRYAFTWILPGTIKSMFFRPFDVCKLTWMNYHTYSPGHFSLRERIRHTRCGVPVFLEPHVHAVRNHLLHSEWRFPTDQLGCNVLSGKGEFARTATRIVTVNAFHCVTIGQEFQLVVPVLSSEFVVWGKEQLVEASRVKRKEINANIRYCFVSFLVLLCVFIQRESIPWVG